VTDRQMTIDETRQNGRRKVNKLSFPQYKKVSEWLHFHQERILQNKPTKKNTIEKIQEDVGFPVTINNLEAVWKSEIGGRWPRTHKYNKKSKDKSTPLSMVEALKKLDTKVMLLARAMKSYFEEFEIQESDDWAILFKKIKVDESVLK